MVTKPDDHVTILVLRHRTPAPGHFDELPRFVPLASRVTLYLLGSRCSFSVRCFIAHGLNRDFTDR